MTKSKIKVTDSTIRVVIKNDIEYISITDIAKQKNPLEPKDVIKNWFRTKNTIEYLGLWELLNNANFKEVEIDPLLKEAGRIMRTLSAQLSWSHFLNPEIWKTLPSKL